MMRRIPLLIGMIILGGLIMALPVMGVDAEAAENDMSVTIQTDVSLSLDRSDPENPVFTGTGDVYATTQDAYSHKHVRVTLPEEYVMGTPKGERTAPAGTKVSYRGSMNARNGSENYKAVNGTGGKTEADICMGQIEVSVPLTKDFLDYGAGSYTMTVPVTLETYTAYGSYSSDLEFTLWSELVSTGGIMVRGSTLMTVTRKDMILDILPGITALSSSFNGLPYMEIDIPSSVTDTNFIRPMNGSRVERVVFGEGRTGIPDNICYGASYLKEVIMPDSVYRFGSDCFKGCVNLENIELPSVMSLGDSCFADCKRITELHISDQVTVSAPHEKYGPFVGSGIKKVVVEDGTTAVPSYICAGCTEVTELYLPESLKKMGYYCFSGMQGLKEVTVRSDISVEATSAVPVFYDTGIETITFTDGVTTVPRYMFAGGCGRAAEINLPDTLRTIGVSAFEGCSSLTDLEIPLSVTTLDVACFKGAASLNELNIRKNYEMPSSCVHSPFEDSGIQKLVFEEGVTSIAPYLFNGGCSKVAELVLPSTLQTVGHEAFKNCSSLRNLIIRSNITLPYTEVVSPFANGSLDSVTFAEGVTGICDYMFAGASVGTLNIPVSMRTIGNKVFDSGSIYRVDYSGTKARWAEVSRNSTFTPVSVTCTDSAGAKEKVWDEEEIIPEEEISRENDKAAEEQADETVKGEEIAESDDTVADNGVQTDGSDDTVAEDQQIQEADGGSAENADETVSESVNETVTENILNGGFVNEDIAA